MTNLNDFANTSNRARYMSISYVIDKQIHNHLSDDMDNIEKINLIYKVIKNYGIDETKHRIVFGGLLFISLLIIVSSLIALSLFLLSLLDISFLNRYSLPIVFVAILIFISNIVLLQKEDNKKYRVWGIELDKPIWRSFQRKAQIKNNLLIKDLFEKMLIKHKVLNGLSNDKEAIRIYVERIEKQSKSIYFDPFIIKHSMPFLSLLVTIILFVYEKFEGVLMSQLIKYVLAFVILFFFIWFLSWVYKSIKNLNISHLNRTCDYLAEIHIKRIYAESEANKNIVRPTLFRRVIDCIQFIKSLF